MRVKTQRITHLVLALTGVLLAQAPRAGLSQPEDPFAGLTDERAEEAWHTLQAADDAWAEQRWLDAADGYHETYRLTDYEPFRLSEAYALKMADQRVEALAICDELAASDDRELAEQATDLARQLELEIDRYRSRLRIAADRFDGRLWVDEEEHSLADEQDVTLEVTPGEHHVSVQVDGYELYERLVAVEPGELVTIEIALADLRPVAELVEPDEPIDDAVAELVEPAGAGRDLTWTYVLGGASLVSVGLGVTFGVLSNQREQEARDFDPNGRRSDLESLQSDADTYATIANVSFVMAGAFAVGAVVAFFLADDGEVVTTSAVSVAPVALPGGGGASLGFRF